MFKAAVSSAALAFVLLSTPVQAQSFGTAAEAKAMLEKAIAELKAGEAAALAVDPIEDIQTTAEYRRDLQRQT